MMSMHEAHLRGIDLNLLPVLDAVLRHKSVTRAAREVGLSQPAASRALARLRDILGDELLVRAAAGMVLTPRAQSLLGPVALAINATKAIYAPQVTDVSQIKRTIVIASLDAQTVMIGPPLAARLELEAPGISVKFVNYSSDLIERMEMGEVDFAFALSSTPLPPNAFSQKLWTDELVMVMRKGHPLETRDIIAADYGHLGHVTISIFDDRLSDIDRILAPLGINRRVAMTVPSLSSALAIVCKTDLVTTLSKQFATRYQNSLDLVLKKPPFIGNAYENVLVWGKLQDRDAVLIWLREVIAHVVWEQSR